MNMFAHSRNPYWIKSFPGDCLLRFCPSPYHPFDAADRDKYVVHDDYRPTWKVPTLAKLYSDLGEICQSDIYRSSHSEWHFNRS